MPAAYSGPRNCIVGWNDNSDYSHIKDEHLRQFLEMNSLETVFDLDEQPTQFNYIVLFSNFGNRLILLELDRDTPESICEEIKLHKFDYNNEQTTRAFYMNMQKKWRLRARLIIRDIYLYPERSPAEVIMITTDGRSGFRYTMQNLVDPEPGKRSRFGETSNN